jgi:hypothetical protein
MKSIYCGGGFSDDQLLWVIPILNGYCKKNNIDTIIFEKKLNQKLKNNNFISRILQKYKIMYLKENLSFISFIKIFFFFFKEILKIIYYSLIIDRKFILNKNISWKKIQIFHSIWDTSFLYLKDGDLNPNFFYKFKASLKIYLNIYFANILINKNIFSAFMGHSVYGARAMIAVLREFKVKIFIQANQSLYNLPSLFDNSWSILSKNTLLQLKKNEIQKKSIKYWQGRLKGYSNYEDAKIAYKKDTHLKMNNFNFDNIILLHIFRDSPFNLIDRKRIFSDYIDWIKNTLAIIKDSKEQWIIKPHPNFKRWGEDSFKVYQQIYKDIFGKNKLNNVKYLNDRISNIELLKKAKRIVTFAGTVHLEAACFGIKPIVISDCTLSSLNKNFVLKPRNFNEYSNLLLSDSESSIFRLNDNQKKNAMFMLFIRENIVNLRKDLKCKAIYRSDAIKLRNNEFNNIRNNLNKKINFLKKTGEFLGKNIQNTFSEEYLKYFKI